MNTKSGGPTYKNIIGSFMSFKAQVSNHFYSALLGPTREKLNNTALEKLASTGLFNLTHAKLLLDGASLDQYLGTLLALFLKNPPGSSMANYFSRLNDYPVMTSICSSLGVDPPEDFTAGVQEFETCLGKSTIELELLLKSEIWTRPGDLIGAAFRKSHIPALLYLVPNLRVLFLNPAPCARPPRNLDLSKFHPESYSNLQHVLIRGISANLSPTSKC